MEFSKRKGPVFDHQGGMEQLMAEARAVALVKAEATPPPSTGPEIPVAPARGPFKVFQPFEMVRGSTERARRTGYKGRDAVQVADAFDVMERQARRKKAPQPFTPGQVSAGRDYRALVERLDSAGVRCSSLESLAQRSSGGGSYSDAVLADSRRLAALRRRIGNGMALEVRRIRPSKRGPNARSCITDRALVDMVCLNEMTLAEVLKHFGWTVNQKAREALRTALARILDRMQGY